ncbi:MAG TPA: hypothetical protein VER17_01735, partial [Tepidisphaeraceae bacterium]|nr:hypothetical protein [Tepidisphaeraceae bacterium]
MRRARAEPGGGARGNGRAPFSAGRGAAGASVTAPRSRRPAPVVTPPPRWLDAPARRSNAVTMIRLAFSTNA